VGVSSGTNQVILLFYISPHILLINPITQIHCHSGNKCLFHLFKGQSDIKALLPKAELLKTQFSLFYLLSILFFCIWKVTRRKEMAQTGIVEECIMMQLFTKVGRVKGK
jgi:hypothetical protein